MLESKDDLAKKFVLHCGDGQAVEMVVLSQDGYYTLCVSSQSGCPVDCKFCLTGIVGFKRNLSAEEIIGQVLLANSEGYPISNLVFMGMGEPLLNYDALFTAIDFMCHEDNLNFGKRKITVSTSGYLASIKRLINDERYINLAFSVGHPNPDQRRHIMPIEERNPLYEVTKLIKEYQKLHNRKLTLEYTLLKGRNDDQFTIKELSNMSKYLDAKINVINLNPHPKIPFEPVTSEKVRLIKGWLKKEGVPVTVRYRKGQDISAACGQLGESHLATEKGK
jgi:23S rRNA (adenine2503-C2)-methyltransferase